MDQDLKANGRIIELKGKAIINGQIKGNILEHDLIIICTIIYNLNLIKGMDKVFIFGLMEGDMKAHMKMIRNMDLVYILGQMEENMKAIGQMESSMEVGSSFKVRRKEKEYGRKEKELNGWLIVILIVGISRNEVLFLTKLYFFLLISLLY